MSPMVLSLVVAALFNMWLISCMLVYVVGCIICVF